MKKKILKNKKRDNLNGEKIDSQAVDLFFTSQMDEWKLMRENYEGLKNIEEKSFWFDGFKFKVQFNLKREKSTFADVSEEVINRRQCFLCVENLPSKQKVIRLNDKFLMLCNPYPIFPQHFTISSKNHVSQSIKKNIRDVLEIARQLSGSYTLIYNGPECGASAPDHLHFQAGKRFLMPIENDINQLKNNFGKVIFRDNWTGVSSINDGLRSIIFFEALELDSTIDLFMQFYNCYSKFCGTTKEPLMNLLCSFDEEFGFSLIVFLRSKHRPQSYFSDEPNKIMISPAAVDLSGLIITSREKDFKGLKKVLVEKSIREVSLESSLFNKFANILKDELN